MTADEMMKVVRRHLPGLWSGLGLDQWTIRVRPEAPEDKDSRAECVRELPYQRAWINIDPGAHADEEGVLVDLRHELFHVVLAAFDLYRTMVESGMDRAALDRSKLAWEFSVEQTVVALERMHQGLTRPVTKTRKRKAPAVKKSEPKKPPGASAGKLGKGAAPKSAPPKKAPAAPPRKAKGGARKKGQAVGLNPVDYPVDYPTA